MKCLLYSSVQNKTNLDGIGAVFMMLLRLEKEKQANAEYKTKFTLVNSRAFWHNVSFINDSYVLVTRLFHVDDMLIRRRKCAHELFYFVVYNNAIAEDMYLEC